MSTITVLLIAFGGVALVLLGLIAYALVIAAKSGAGEALEEVEPQPVACEGTICAWCHPGIDHPGGHGICPMHRDQLLADLKASPSCRKTTES